MRTEIMQAAPLGSMEVELLAWHLSVRIQMPRLGDIPSSSPNVSIHFLACTNLNQIVGRCKPLLAQCPITSCWHTALPLWQYVRCAHTLCWLQCNLLSAQSSLHHGWIRLLQSVLSHGVHSHCLFLRVLLAELSRHKCQAWGMCIMQAQFTKRALAGGAEGVLRLIALPELADLAEDLQKNG